MGDSNKCQVCHFTVEFLLIQYDYSVPIRVKPWFIQLTAIPRQRKEGNRIETGDLTTHRFKYPLDSNCTYYIRGKKGDQILLYFKQFALYEENSKEECKDYVEIFDVLHSPNGTEILLLQAKHCWTMCVKPVCMLWLRLQIRI